jgi:RimJ/RimL family protein N-acetyltransferase
MPIGCRQASRSPVILFSGFILSMKADATFTSFPSITSDRLHLREIRPTDAEAFFSLKSDLEVTSSYGREPHRTIEDTKTWPGFSFYKIPIAGGLASCGVSLLRT